MLGLEHGLNSHVFELTMSNSEDGCVEFLVGRQDIYNVKAVFVLYCSGVCPGVEDSDVQVVFIERFHYVNHLGVAHVGTVLLEGKAEDDNVAVEHLNAFLEHQLDYAVGNVRAHAVVHSAARKYDFRVVAVTLCALCKVVGVDAYAVAAYKAGLEGKEVPLCGSCLKHILSIDTHECENL